jgi:hypothetical protein
MIMIKLRLPFGGHARGNLGRSYRVPGCRPEPTGHSDVETGVAVQAGRHGALGLCSRVCWSRRVDVSPLLSDTLPFTEARRAFELAGDKSRSMKVQLDFA